MHECIEVEEKYLLRVATVGLDDVVIPFKSAIKLYHFVKSCCLTRDDFIKSASHVYSKVSTEQWEPVAYQLGAIYYIKQVA